MADGLGEMLYDSRDAWSCIGLKQVGRAVLLLTGNGNNAD